MGNSHSGGAQHGKVSIVIPCFNDGSLLREAISSVERARNDNLHEVIVVDDGSTDGETLRIFAELERVGCIVVHQQNSGLGAARNAGIELATGEFILPLDSDNMIRTPYLVDGVAALERSPEIGVVYGHAEYFGERTGRWNAPEFDITSLACMNTIDACALFRKSAWKSVGGYDEKMPRMGWEDWDLWLRIAAHGWHFLRLDSVAFDYRVRSGSMITEANQHSDDLLRYILDKRENQLVRHLRDAEFARRHLEGGLASVTGSKSYRLGRFLLQPVRAVRDLFGAK